MKPRRLRCVLLRGIRLCPISLQSACITLIAIGLLIAPARAGTAVSERKTLIDYFLPIPIRGQLSRDAWGAATVGPRDQTNGLEDPTIKKWNYWDGQIVTGSDGKWHMFASRWDQAKGH